MKESALRLVATWKLYTRCVYIIISNTTYPLGTRGFVIQRTLCPKGNGKCKSYFVHPGCKADRRCTNKSQESILVLVITTIYGVCCRHLGLRPGERLSPSQSDCISFVYVFMSVLIIFVLFSVYM